MELYQDINLTIQTIVILHKGHRQPNNSASCTLGQQNKLQKLEKLVGGGGGGGGGGWGGGAEGKIISFNVPFKPAAVVGRWKPSVICYVVELSS